MTLKWWFSGSQGVITDNTNGMTGVRNTWSSTKALAALAAREFKGKMSYGLMVGVNQGVAVEGRQPPARPHAA